MTAKCPATGVAHDWNRVDWVRKSPEAHLNAARAADPAALCALVRCYDWDLHPEPVLGWAMGQRHIDLASAVTVFSNGTPERFNHLHKRDVPLGFRSAALVLDNICLRLNSGFYAARDTAPGTDLDRLSKWIDRQQADRRRGISGRWVLDEQIVARLWQDSVLDACAPLAVRRPAPPRTWFARWRGARAAQRASGAVQAGE